jgi:hypothetical protein
MPRYRSPPPALPSKVSTLASVSQKVERPRGQRQRLAALPSLKGGATEPLKQLPTPQSTKKNRKRKHKGDVPKPQPTPTPDVQPPKKLLPTFNLFDDLEFVEDSVSESWEQKIQEADELIGSALLLGKMHFAHQQTPMFAGHGLYKMRDSRKGSVTAGDFPAAFPGSRMRGPLPPPGQSPQGSLPSMRPPASPSSLPSVTI